MDQRSLLNGNIKKQLLGLALPLLIGSTLQQLYNTIDALIVGHFLGTDAFAAVGVAGTVMNLFIFVLSGFCIGLSILFARLFGQENENAFRKEMFVSLTFGSLFTLLLSALFICLLRPALRLINTPERLMADASSYLLIIISGMIATYFYNLFSGILRSIGNTRAALYFLAVSIVLSAVMGYLFVAVFSMGVAGTATATVLAQGVSALSCWLYLFKHHRRLICTRKDAGVHGAFLRETLRFGFSSALQQASLYIGKILVQGAVNTLGTPGIAAYTAATRVESFANSFGDSGAQAVSVLISQNQGAGKEERVKEGLKKGMALHVLAGLILSLLLFLAAKAGVGVFLKAGETEALFYGASYLRVISLFYTLCFIGSAFVGYFRGVGKMAVTVVGTTLQITLRVILTYLTVARLKLPAVALATGLGWVLVVLYQSVTYRLLKAKKTLLLQEQI